MKENFHKIYIIKEKLPQHWFEVKSLKENIFGDATPVRFPGKLYNLKTLASRF